MYEYIIFMGVLFLLYLWIFKAFPLLQHQMLYTGILYAIVLVPLFWVHWAMHRFLPVSELYNPAYWHPNTLFNLGNITGGCEIEALLFMILFGGIVSVIPFLYGTFIIKAKARKSRKLFSPTHAPILAFLVFYIFFLFTRINPIYLLIYPSFFGALTILFLRKDLVKELLVSGILFTLIYFIGFLAFNLLFPYFIQTYYNLNAIPFYVLGVPFPEILYALSFGMMWGPMFKVVKGYR